VDPQIPVPELELVQVYLHAGRLHLRRREAHLVLRLPGGLGQIPLKIILLLSPLVLRVTCQNSRHSRNDHHSFGRHRVLRDILGHSRQRLGGSGGGRGLPVFAASTAACQRRPRSHSACRACQA
jgi:hypothetical protein